MRRPAIIAAFAALSACQSTQDAATNTGFRTPNANGFINDGVLTGPISGQAYRVRDAEGDGFAYSVGKAQSSGDGFVGFAGLLPTTSVRAQPSNGTATYDARYNVLTIEGIDLNGELLTGQIGSASGDITLRADFKENTLRGSDGRLRVRGELVEGSNAIGGTVTFKDVSGDLRGKAGSDEVVGAFHGNNANIIYAGGFIGDAR